jgi:hypothetical protein
VVLIGRREDRSAKYRSAGRPSGEPCSGGGSDDAYDCPGAALSARITRALVFSSAHPHRPGRVRRIWTHGGGPLPARLRPHPAKRRWRVGAWQSSLAGGASTDRSCDPCPATCDGSPVPVRRADAGRGVTRARWERREKASTGAMVVGRLHRSRLPTVASSVPIRYADAPNVRASATPGLCHSG